VFDATYVCTMSLLYREGSTLTLSEAICLANFIADNLNSNDLTGGTKSATATYLNNINMDLNCSSKSFGNTSTEELLEWFQTALRRGKVPVSNLLGMHNSVRSNVVIKRHSSRR
jgi:hypothetical protein